MAESHSTPLVQAYQRMMERLKERLEELEQAEQAAFPQLSASIEHVAEKAGELGELPREEARLVGGHLQRRLGGARGGPTGRRGSTSRGRTPPSPWWRGRSTR